MNRMSKCLVLLLSVALCSGVGMPLRAGTPEEDLAAAREKMTRSQAYLNQPRHTGVKVAVAVGGAAVLVGLGFDWGWRSAGQVPFKNVLGGMKDYLDAVLCWNRYAREVQKLGIPQMTPLMENMHGAIFTNPLNKQLSQHMMASGLLADEAQKSAYQKIRWALGDMQKRIGGLQAEMQKGVHLRPEWVKEQKNLLSALAEESVDMLREFHAKYPTVPYTRSVREVPLEILLKQDQAMKRAMGRSLRATEKEVAQSAGKAGRSSSRAGKIVKAKATAPIVAAGIAVGAALLAAQEARAQDEALAQYLRENPSELLMWDAAAVDQLAAAPQKWPQTTAVYIQTAEAVDGLVRQLQQLSEPEREDLLDKAYTLLAQDEAPLLPSAAAVEPAR